MKIMGSTTIHPFFLYTGKGAGYFTEAVLLPQKQDVIVDEPRHLTAKGKKEHHQSVSCF